MTNTGLTLCAIFRIPPAGVEAFQSYEDAVLPLLRDHGGTLQRRLRSEDGLTEVHVIWFPSASHFDAYRADPRRSERTGLFTEAGATAEVVHVQDINDA